MFVDALAEETESHSAAEDEVKPEAAGGEASDTEKCDDALAVASEEAF